MVAEFHDLDTNTELFNESFARLNQHFYCIHVHGNNFSPYSQEHDFPCVIEITFLNKFLLSGSVTPVERSYPIAQLNFACNLTLPVTRSTMITRCILRANQQRLDQVKPLKSYLWEAPI